MTSIQLTTDGQLSKVILRASDKTPLQRPPRQCRVRCHYVASLANGTGASFPKNETDTKGEYGFNLLLLLLLFY
jgi:hypothetical protein